MSVIAVALTAGYAKASYFATAFRNKILSW